MEDAVRAWTFRSAVPDGPEITALLVADGAGGHNAGEVASDICARLTPAHLAAWFASGHGEANAGSGALADALVYALRRANAAVLRRACESPETAGMATTAVCALLVGDRCSVAWVGDSRCYLYSNGTLYRITHDHSERQRLLDAGLLGKSGILFPSHPAHTIHRYCGQPKGFQPEVRVLRIRPGNMLILCTDGLTDVLMDEEIADILRTYAASEEACDQLPVRLVDAALAAGATDNVTLLCCKYEPSPYLCASIPAETLTGAYPAAMAKVLFPVKEVEYV